MGSRGAFNFDAIYCSFELSIDLTVTQLAVCQIKGRWYAELCMAVKFNRGKVFRSGFRQLFHLDKQLKKKRPIALADVL